MKLHFRSKDGSLLCIALRCYQEQLMDVSASIILNEGNCRKQFEGMLPLHHSNWRSKIDKDTVVVYDQVGEGDEAKQLKMEGISVIGAGPFHDYLELDRLGCMEWLDQHKIRTPETHIFNDFDKAKEFISKTPYPLIFKPSGELPPDTTYVASAPGNEDLLFHLDKLEKMSKGAEFILQRKVEGIEISSEVWYYQGKPLLPHNHTFEEKKSLNEGLGPSTGCAGNVVTIHRGPCFIYDHVFRPIEEDLRAEQYTGVLDWNSIYNVEEGRLYVIEATSRFGYDAIQCLCGLFLLPLSEVFWKWGKGELEELPLLDSPSIGVRVTIPLEKGKKEAPAEEYIGGVEGADGYWFSDVKQLEGRIVTAGWDGNILTATSSSFDIEVAKAQVYSKLDKLILGAKSYRTDIGKRFKEDWDSILRANSHYIKATAEYIQAEKQEDHKRKKLEDDYPPIEFGGVPVETT